MADNRNIDHYTVIILKFDGKIESVKLHGSDFEIVSNHSNFSIFFPEYRYEHDDDNFDYFDCPNRKSAKYNAKIVVTDCGPTLTSILLKEKLVNEISLLIHPAINQDLNFFEKIKEEVKLKLIKEEKIEQLFHVVYEVLNK